MKKTFTIFLLVLYVTLSAGMTIIIHTCGGESEAIIATTSVDDPCGCAGEMPTDNCCTTELKSAKIDDAQKISIATIVETLTTVGSVATPLFTAQYSHELRSQFIPYVSPPPNNDLHIINSVFLI